MRRPRIGLNCDLKADVAQLNLAYAEAVLRGGGLPLGLVPLGEGLIEEALSSLDGLLLTGGRDYDPALYGQPQHDETQVLDPRRVAFDMALARSAIARGVPTLGVCGGAQLLNIAAGGTLLQHVPDRAGAAIAHRGPVLHEAAVAPGSRLAAILGAGAIEVNSSHHQAVDEPGRGLRIVAHAPDGIVEAVEGTGEAFLLGVQWHPERLLERERHVALFRALVEAARREERGSG